MTPCNQDISTDYGCYQVHARDKFIFFKKNVLIVRMRITSTKRKGKHTSPSTWNKFHKNLCNYNVFKLLYPVFYKKFTMLCLQHGVPTTWHRLVLYGPHDLFIEKKNCGNLATVRQKSGKEIFNRVLDVLRTENNFAKKSEKGNLRRWEFVLFWRVCKVFGLSHPILLFIDGQKAKSSCLVPPLLSVPFMGEKRFPLVTPLLSVCTSLLLRCSSLTKIMNVSSVFKCIMGWSKIVFFKRLISHQSAWGFALKTNENASFSIKPQKLAFFNSRYPERNFSKQTNIVLQNIWKKRFYDIFLISPLIINCVLCRAKLVCCALVSLLFNLSNIEVSVKQSNSVCLPRFVS